MRDYIRSLYDKENNEELYVFNVTHTACIILMLVMCGTSIIFYSNITALYLTFGTLSLFILTMVTGNRTGAVTGSVIFMSVILNFLYLPFMYRLYDWRPNIIPVYFIFGIMYSVLHLPPKSAALLGGIETAIYYMLIHFFEKTNVVQANNLSPREAYVYYSGAVIAVAAAGVCAGVIMSLRLGVYERARETAAGLNEEAMDAYVARDMFLINMSHEIRTPMNAIVGNVNLILDEDISPRVSENAYNILNSCNALLSVTDELMDLSRADDGDVPLRESSYDLAELLLEVINMVSVRLAESDIGFFVDINKNIPRFLYGDASKLRQLFVNLLNNAVKFTESGKITMGVDFGHTDGELIELMVDIEDTGKGIRQEDIGDLFDHPADEEGYDVTGLGLYICADIVRQMKGDISASSEYMKGSSFTFKVPQRITSMDTIAYIADAGNIFALVFEKNDEYTAHFKKIFDSLEISADYATKPHELQRLAGINEYDYIFISNERYEECEDILNGLIPGGRVVVLLDNEDIVHISRAQAVLARPVNVMSIAALIRGETNPYVRDISRRGSFRCPAATLLVVDDNYTNLNVAGAMLSKYGASVLTAASGMDCLAILNSRSVDMVFLDYMMPEMDGIDTLQRIRQIPGSGIAAMPVIALTANVVSGAREMFLEAGFDDFIPKPISTDRLEKVLRKYLRRDLIQ